mgnify:CR=1 FL=1
MRQGRIGRPRTFYWHDVGEAMGKWGWRNFKRAAGAGWTLDGGVHFAALYLYQLGTRVHQVTALTSGTRFDIDLDVSVVEGCVTDEWGSPVAGARVTVRLARHDVEQLLPGFTVRVVEIRADVQFVSRGIVYLRRTMPRLRSQRKAMRVRRVSTVDYEVNTYLATFVVRPNIHVPLGRPGQSSSKY